MVRQAHHVRFDKLTMIGSTCAVLSASTAHHVEVTRCHTSIFTHQTPTSPGKEPAWFLVAAKGLPTTHAGPRNCAAWAILYSKSPLWRSRSTAVSRRLSWVGS